MLNKPAVTLVEDANGIFNVCVEEEELNAGAVPDVPTVNVCVPDVIPLIAVIPVTAAGAQEGTPLVKVSTCPFVPAAKKSVIFVAV